MDSFVPTLRTLREGRWSLTHALKAPPVFHNGLGRLGFFTRLPWQACTHITFTSVLEEFARTVSDARICPCLHISVNRASPAESVFVSNTFLVVRCFFLSLVKIMCVKTGEIATSQDLSLDPLQHQLAVCPAKIWSVLRTYHNYINPNRQVLSWISLSQMISHWILHHLILFSLTMVLQRLSLSWRWLTSFPSPRLILLLPILKTLFYLCSFA